VRWLQGQTTKDERDSGASAIGFNCNLELVGQFQGEGSKSWHLAWFDDCAYYGTNNNPLQQHRGSVVVDASDPRPPPLNIEQPFRNSMEALRPAELPGSAPTVTLMRDTGTSATAVTTLTPSYRGRGMFQVSHAFAETELGGQENRTFWLHVQLTDDNDCVVDGAADEEEYHFPVGR
jgi:hypothetical protein